MIKYILTLIVLLNVSVNVSFADDDAVDEASVEDDSARFMLSPYVPESDEADTEDGQKFDEVDFSWSGLGKKNPQSMENLKVGKGSGKKYFDFSLDLKKPIEKNN